MNVATTGRSLLMLSRAKGGAAVPRCLTIAPRTASCKMFSAKADKNDYSKSDRKNRAQIEETNDISPFDEHWAYPANYPTPEEVHHQIELRKRFKEQREKEDFVRRHAWE